MTLMLYTACRREDACRLGPQHIRGDRLVFTQAKNEHRNPVNMNIPLHPELKRAIDAVKLRNLTFLTTPQGKPYSSQGFSGWFRHACIEAGLKHCSPHGLRKASWLSAGPPPT